MNPAFLDYAQFEGFWAQFTPLTPFGREEKERLTLHTEAAALETLWDLTEAAAPLLDGDPVRLDRISHHLQRLPRFPLDPRPVYGEVELFQFKKFLFNYRSLLDLLPAQTRTRFGLACSSEALARTLDTGRQSAESFYVADAYSQELKAVREELRALDTASGQTRAQRRDQIQTQWGLAFGHQDFALVDRTVLTGDPERLLLVEPYDDLHVLVRPRRSPEELMLAERRTEFLAREAALEAGVLEALSHAVREELDRFGEYVAAVRTFDLALARARLAREQHLTRPQLGAGPVTIEAGRFPPCQATCTALGTPYVPLDALFACPATVVFGSNMGGKTIVLKTLAFLQLCTQTGLFVPADCFSTRVFRHFHYVGEGGKGGPEQGLSGFGAEIQRFNQAWADCQGPALVLLDEFARTTQSREAEAILSAVLEALGRRPSVLALCSTHFRGVGRFQGVRYLRMKGLDRASLAGSGELRERIRAVNRCMDYRLVPDEGAQAASDAIAVAELLGLEATLARRAEYHYLQP